MSSFTAQQRAELRDAVARARIEYEADRQRMQEGAAEAERRHERERKAAWRAEQRRVRGELEQAEHAFTEFLTSPVAREIVARLRATACEFSTIDVDEHVLRVAQDALAAKRVPRNRWAKATA